MEIEFNENKQSDYNYQPKKLSLGSLFIKMGLAKDEAGAQKVMILVMIICFSLSIYFFMKI